MFNIANNQIVTMTRGDTAEMYIYINIGTELAPYWYYLGDYDKVYFALMEPHQKFEDAILKRVFSKKDLKVSEQIPYVVLTFNTGDTENLVPGVYYYTIKLARNSDISETNPIVDTIVSKKKFNIIE